MSKRIDLEVCETCANDNVAAEAYDTVTDATVGECVGFSRQPCTLCEDPHPGQRVEVSVTIADW